MVLAIPARLAPARLRHLAPRTVLAALTAASLALGAPAAVGGETPTVAPADVPLVKAAIIYNICKFVEWPSTAATSKEFVIGTTDVQDDGPNLAALAGKDIRGRTVRVVDIKDASDLASCHAVYLGHDDIDAGALRAIAGKPILTFSETLPDGTSSGAIEIVFDGPRIRFKVHRGTAEQAGLRLSSQLLKLALSVTDD